MDEDVDFDKWEKDHITLEHHDHGFRKNDGGKPKLSLIPIEAMNEVAKVMEFGAEKYGRDNYKRGCHWTRYIDAALRHIGAWCSGEDDDEESGQSHIAHAQCCLLMLQYQITTDTGKDDRR